MAVQGVRRAITIFGAAAFVDSLGTGTFLAGSALYFTRSVGLSASQVSIGVTASAVCGLLATVPWGHAAHRFGARRVYLILLLARALCFAGYALVTDFPAYLLVAVLLGTVDKPATSVQQELVAVAIGGMDRQRALGWIRTTRNVGFAVGSGTAGLVSVLPELGGYRVVVLINAASFVVAAFLVTLLPKPPASAARAATGRRLTGLLADRRYLALTGVNGVLTAHMALLSIGLPLWVVSRTGLPAITVPILIGINAVLAMLLQVPVAARVGDTATATRTLVVAGALLAGCCAVAALLPLVTRGVGLVLAVLAVLLLTGAELAQSAGGWKLSFDLAPEHGRAVYLARFSLGLTMQQIVLPVVLTVAVFRAGTAGWLVLGLLLAAAGMLAPRVVRLPPPVEQAATAPAGTGTR